MEYRAYITDASGGVRDVPQELIHDSGDFFGSWERSTDTPHEFQAGAWQLVDDAHPAGSGMPAYRIVYKSMRMLTHPSLVLEWPNLRVKISNGDVDRGGMRLANAMAGRKARHWVIPEFGRVVDRTDGVTYLSCPDMRFTFEAWQENLKAVSYVEIIFVPEPVDDETSEGLLVRGREGIASVKATLDLKYGPRLLAIPITEEVGETFEDWHWNRAIYTGLVSAETQAKWHIFNTPEMARELDSIIPRNQQSDIKTRRRVALASQWYWMADAEADPVIRFAYWWLVLESLEMVNTTNVKPVRMRLAQMCGTTEDFWRDIVGRLYGVRSGVLHGNSREVSAVDLERVELLARVLLTARLLGGIADDQREALLNMAD